MIKKISVLDIRRGDTVIVGEGKGRHRGDSADSGCFEASVPAMQSLATYNLRTFGKHAKPRAQELYSVFLGYEGLSVDEDRMAVPATVAVEVMR